MRTRCSPWFLPVSVQSIVTVGAAVFFPQEMLPSLGSPDVLGLQRPEFLASTAGSKDSWEFWPLSPITYLPCSLPLLYTLLWKRINF